MNREELIKKIGDLEWEDFEVKEAKSEVPRSSWETVSSFSNTNGGWLIFGVKQNGKRFEIQGIDNSEKIEQDFLNTLRGEKFNVFVDTRQTRYKIDGNKLLGFYIPPSSKKPVYFNSPKNTFIRRGSSDQRATKVEVDAMYRDQSFGTKTAELAPKTSEIDLKEKSIQEYRNYMANFNPEVSYNRMNTNEFLSKMRVLDLETGQCTYGGLLFFGQRDSLERSFADFRIDLLEVPGTSYEDATSRYTFRLSEDDYENIWEAYFECFRRIRKEVDVTYKVSAEGFGEELSPGLQAAREALVNMLMHTDYFSPAKSRIRIFTNHLEYYNPGGLPKPLKELKDKDLSLPRNPILAKLFRMVKLAENAGFGLDKIYDNWKEYNNTEPVYENSFDYTNLKLFTKSEGEIRKTSESLRRDFGETSERLKKELQKETIDNALIYNILRDNFEHFLVYLENEFPKTSERLRRDFGVTTINDLNQQQVRILQLLLLIFLNGSITAVEIGSILDISERTVRRTLKELSEQNIIKREGSRKLGKWNIISGNVGF